MKRCFSIVLAVAMIQLVLVSPSFADPIHDFAESGDHHGVADQIADGVDVNARDQYERTPLDIAALMGHMNVLEVLLANPRIDVNTTYGSCGFTSLHYAAGNGHAEIIRALIAAGANIRAVNKFTRTPVQLACERYHSDIAHIFEPESLVQIHMKAGAARTIQGRFELATLNYARAAQSYSEVFFNYAAAVNTVAGFIGADRAEATIHSAVAQIDSIEANRIGAVVLAIRNLEATQVQIDGFLEATIEGAANEELPGEERGRHAANEPRFRALAVQISTALDHVRADAEASRLAVAEARTRVVVLAKM